MFQIFIDYVDNEPVPLDEFENKLDAIEYLNSEINMIREVEEDFKNDLFFILDYKTGNISYDGLTWISKTQNSA